MQRDEAKWLKWYESNSDDAYGMAILTFAERWATLMEARMAVGKTIPECAKEASSEANTEGITGFMYGAAVSTLADCWEHGDELRRWHNRDIQIGSEGDAANESGGVLNPALLSFG